MIGDFLAKKMKNSIEKKAKKSILRKEGLEPLLKEMKLNLLDADVNLEVVDKFLENIKLNLENKNLIENLNASQTVSKVVHTELKNILGKTTSKLNISKKPSIILMVGLQGSGKTTTTAKLASLIQRKENKKVLLVACDVYRPAAVEQLKILSNKVQAGFFSVSNNKNPIEIANLSIAYANKNNYDCIIIDTAGRMQIDEKLMNEIKNIKQSITPSETLLVVDGMIGQEVINITSSFDKKISLTGVIVSKLDGDARGGATFSISYLTNIPIKFIGTGEGVYNIDVFHPKRMADRILGMGDVDSLFEKLQENIDERTIKTTIRRMMSGQFDLQDYLNQLRQMKKMGNFGSVLKMIPGLNSVSENKVEEITKKLFITEIILSSTTIKERREPRLLKHFKRKTRIIKGSGRTEKEFNELINQFDKINKKILEIKKQMHSGKMPNFGNINSFLR